ncbi:MAG: hypothetical protein E7620_07990 [Ruminococcaceae bacterium]|nr:hypothetical protein [Oscillospiraceae bacterium]
MKKRIVLFTILVVMISVMLMLSLSVAAGERDGYSYTISNGEVRIYAASSSLSGELVIPEEIEGYPVTKIGSYAFSNCKNLTGVQLPSTLVAIENAAFSGCSSLELIVIPNSVVSMGEDTFKDCTALKSFVFSSGMTEIPPQTFSGCSSLEAIMIPENIRSVGRSAFQGCSSAKEIYIPKSVTEIGYVAFADCSSAEKITIPFVGESLSGDSNRVFGDIFAGSNQYNVPQSLKEVVILGGNDIPKGAFEDCVSIEKIDISDCISNIEEKAFYNCPSLKEIVVDEKNSTYHSSGNCLIESKTKRLLLGCQASVIPDDGTVTAIGSYAFGNCTELKKIVVPNSIQKIERYAFFGCASLEEISLPFVGEKASNTSNTHFGYIFGAGSVESHNAVFIPEALKKVVLTGDCSIAAHAFMSCRNIGSFTATSNLKQIHEFAFLDCSGLQVVRFEGKLEAISQSAFLNCTSLKEILLPNSVRTIGKAVFENCSKVKLFCVKGSVAEQYAINNKIAYEITGTPPEDVTEQPRPSESEPVPKPETEPETQPDPEPATESATEPDTDLETDSETEAGKKGCKSSIGIGAVILVALAAGGAIVLRKKED